MNSPDDDAYSANLIPVWVDCSGCENSLVVECLPSEREDIELGYLARFCKECKKDGHRDG